MQNADHAVAELAQRGMMPGAAGAELRHARSQLPGSDPGAGEGFGILVRLDDKRPRELETWRSSGLAKELGASGSIHRGFSSPRRSITRWREELVIKERLGDAKSGLPRRLQMWKPSSLVVILIVCFALLRLLKPC